jgi:hypothetical protein
MIPEIRAGVALLYPGTGPDDDEGRSHICVVVKDDQMKGDLYLVPVCSYRRPCDETCVIDANSGWRTITKKSFVAYYHPRIVSKKATLHRIKEADVTFLGPVPQDIYERIFDGIKTSRHVEPWFRNVVIGEPPKPTILPTK